MYIPYKTWWKQYWCSFVPLIFEDLELCCQEGEKLEWDFWETFIGHLKDGFHISSSSVQTNDDECKINAQIQSHFAVTTDGSSCDIFAQVGLLWPWGYDNHNYRMLHFNDNVRPNEMMEREWAGTTKNKK